MRLFRILFGAFILTLSFFHTVLAVGEGSRINMGVSPIRHEFTVSPGQTLQREVIFYNNSDVPYDIYLTLEDCVSEDNAGTPKCRQNIKTGKDPESLSSWITYDTTDRFIVPPNSEKKFNIIVSPPSDAIPGGHYGALFFNNPDTGGVGGGNSVQMVKRTGILLLATIPGNIIYDTQFGEIGIDLTSAPVLPSDIVSRIKRELDPRITPPVLVETGFGMNFSVPVKNKGNTHIMPVGRIELYDDGDLLESIGKESVKSEEGVFLGERIVDYLPINDEAGNVLPNSDRTYVVYWKGFAYEEIENGKKVIKFLSPSEYYSRKSGAGVGYTLPWEKLKIVQAKKNILAKVHLEYKKSDGTIESHDHEQTITVEYNYIDKGVNWGALLIILGLVLIIWILMALFRRDEDKIEELEEEVEELEEELDELEKGRKLAKAALAKKKTTKAMKVLETPEEKVTPQKSKSEKTATEPSVKKTPVKRVSKKSNPEI